MGTALSADWMRPIRAASGYSRRGPGGNPGGRPHQRRARPRLWEWYREKGNRGDGAKGADRTKLNPTRLGARGPRLPLNVPGNVNLIDASEVVTGLLEHSYFVDDVATGRDLLAVLGGEPPDQITGRRYVTSQNRYVLV